MAYTQQRQQRQHEKYENGNNGNIVLTNIKHVLEIPAFQSQPKVSYNFLAERSISENLGIFVIKIIISICFEVRTILKW